KWCDDINTVTSLDATSSTIMDIISFLITGSRPDVGSSSIRISGFMHSLY
ncbi:MAG: hypothetical protein ACJAX4_004226, partial [Clostridium sp.]